LHQDRKIFHINLPHLGCKEKQSFTKIRTQAKYVKVKLTHNQSKKQQTNQPQIASSTKPSLHGLLMLQTWQKRNPSQSKRRNHHKRRKQIKKRKYCSGKT
jgi:hypothetical protein